MEEKIPSITLATMPPMAAETAAMKAILDGVIKSNNDAHVLYFGHSSFVCFVYFVVNKSLPHAGADFKELFHDAVEIAVPDARSKGIVNFTVERIKFAVNRGGVWHRA